MGFVANFIRF